PDMLTDYERGQLKTLSNVEIRPAVHYRDAPEIISTFDVCILPHRRTPFTESLNPIKLWEYLASGKPIAATSVAGFRDFAHLCFLGDGAAGFVAACNAAYGDGTARGEERVRVAEANSWKSRVDDLEEVFRQEGWIGRPWAEAARHSREVFPSLGSNAVNISRSNVSEASMREVALESNCQ
ncbi:MAG: glycosyltransferase, partial [Verrucomicrobiota bacterium]